MNLTSKMSSSSKARTGLGLGIVAMAMVLAGCGSSSAPGTESPAASDTNPATSPTAPAGADPAVVALLPDSVKAGGTLTVGTEAQYPPFESYDTDNKTIIGFDADIAAGLAKLMGLQLSMQDAAFDSIIPSLASGRYNLGMSAFSVTPDRIKQVDFVTYFQGGDGLMVKAGNPSSLAIDDTLCGVKVAVLKGSTQAVVSVPKLDEACTTAGKPAIDATVVPGSNDLGLSLSSGRVEAVLTDASNAASTAKLSNGKFELAAGPLFNPAPWGIATQKNGGMAPVVQKALEAMIADGSYMAALTKWGLESGAITTPKINEVAG